MQIAASKVVVELTPSEALPAVAYELLTVGHDSRSMVELAGLTNPRHEDATELLRRAFVELGEPWPTPASAVRTAVRSIATQILDGKIGPYEGAKVIWDLSLRTPRSSFPELDTFIYGASEWEERPEDRAMFLEGIMAAARDLADP